jgi:hypothetical protein
MGNARRETVVSCRHRGQRFDLRPSTDELDAAVTEIIGAEF